MKISVADTRVLDVDKNFIGAGLPHGYLLVFNRTTGLLKDLGPLLFRNFGCHGVYLEAWKGT
jgi:hypothetical protein